MRDQGIYQAVRNPRGHCSAWGVEIPVPDDCAREFFRGTQGEVIAFCEGRCVRDNGDWRVERSYWDGKLAVSLYFGPNSEKEIYLAAWMRPEREGWSLYGSGDRESLERRLGPGSMVMVTLAKLFDALDKGMSRRPPRSGHRNLADLQRHWDAALAEARVPEEEWTVVTAPDWADTLRSTMMAPLPGSTPAFFLGTRLEAQAWMLGRWTVGEGDDLKQYLRNGEMPYRLSYGPEWQADIRPGPLPDPVGAGWAFVAELPRAALIDRMIPDARLHAQVQAYFAALDKGVASIDSTPGS